MFGMLESLVKAAAGVVSIPVSVACDVVTMGGALNDKECPYTVKTAEDIAQNLMDAFDPKK